MKLTSMMQTAKAMGLNNGKINEVVKMASEYGLIQNGEITGNVNIAKNIIAKNGGEDMVNKALGIAQNPLVKMGLKKMGIDESTLSGAVNEIRGVVGQPSNVTVQAPQNDLMNRLAKLK